MWSTRFWLYCVILFRQHRKRAQYESKPTLRTSIIFSFTDTGIGIPEEIQSRLFTPLVTTKAKGMGMSLAICKRVVEAHGGKIAIESKVGAGTTVKVSLPVVATRKEFADLQARLTTI